MKKVISVCGLFVLMLATSCVNQSPEAMGASANQAQQSTAEFKQCDKKQHKQEKKYSKQHKGKKKCPHNHGAKSEGEHTKKCDKVYGSDKPKKCCQKHMTKMCDKKHKPKKCDKHKTCE